MKPLRPLFLAALAIAVPSPELRAQCGPDVLQELAAGDPQPGAKLGRSVALDADTLVAGAPTADLNVNGFNVRGATYVWRRVGGTWLPEAKIPGPAAPKTYFGSGVDVSGDVLLAGGFSGSFPYERAWIYRRNGSNWIQEAELTAGDPLTAGSTVPHDVAVEGVWAAVGHYKNKGTPVSSESTGAVYVYRFDGSTWSQVEKLVPSDAGSGDQVGWNVELAGGVLAYDSRTAATFEPGRVHVHRVVGTSLVPEATLTAPDPLQGLDFGYGLSCDGARIAVSDIADTTLAGHQGAVHVFVHTPGGWVLEQSLRPFVPAGTSAQFGQEVALDGDDLVVSGTKTLGGVARLWHFRRVGGVWVELGQGALPATPGYDVEGLDLESGVVAVGSPTSDLPEVDSGAVYLFDPASSQPVCTYCTGKLNSQGCVPSIGWSGAPSAGAGSGFVISAAGLVPGNNGLLFYGTGGPQATPFLGGTLCAGSPITRTNIQNSGGAAPCSGTFAMDFNAWIAAGSDPTLVVGAQVGAQYWSRDVPASFGSSVSDAIGFVVLP